MSGQTLQKAFIPLPGRATAVYTSSGLSYYRHPDWLGSARFGSTPSRTMYSDVAYAPFGEPYAQAGATDLSFTGINQDTDSDSFDFPARQYSTQGRWASPDPAGLAAVDPAFPQSWNHYAYVMNNPLALIDPFGLDFCQWDDGSKDDRPEDGGEGLGGCLDQGGTWVTEGGAGDGCISTMIGSGIQVTCPGPPDPCALPGSCGGGAGGGATLSAPPGLITAIGPQTNWAHSRQEQCLEEAAKAFAGGIVMKKEIDALLTPILGAPQTDGPVGASWQSLQKSV